MQSLSGIFQHTRGSPARNGLLGGSQHLFLLNGYVLFVFLFVLIFGGARKKAGLDLLNSHETGLDPEGDFVEAIGRQHSAEKAASIIKAHMSDWKDGRKKRDS